MHPFVTRIGLLSTLALVITACAGGAAPAGTTGTDGAPASAEAVQGAAWRSAQLTDVRAGEPFTIEGLEGKLVAIEPMAIWCSNCRIQQREAAAALEALGSDDVVYIGLDVDANEHAEVLAAYAEDEGFAWTYAIASPDVARSLAAEFGDQVLSPPSTPLILLAPDGTVIETHFGIREAEELEALFRQHLP
jgi:cytochrome oxidase Cu insertion factor (SCO1/SenC/PrrC family)